MSEGFSEEYLPEVTVNDRGIWGENEGLKLHYTALPQTPIIKAWLEDDDLQHLTVASANIGFRATYEKQFRKKKETK